MFYPRTNKPYTPFLVSKMETFTLATAAMISKKRLFPVNWNFIFPMTFHQFIISSHENKKSLISILSSNIFLTENS